MPAHPFYRSLLALLVLTLGTIGARADVPVFADLDIFEIEWAEDPQISPDGRYVVYRRMGFDVMRDGRRGNLWLLDMNSGTQRKLSTFEGDESHPRWSGNSDRIAYVRKTSDGERTEIYLHWLDGAREARITRLPASPTELRWRPDGQALAFAMTVDAEPPALAKRPKAPEGAAWAEPPRFTDLLYHERDGAGPIKPGFSHVFVVPAEGGTARQISSGDYHHREPAWSADGKTLYVTGNRSDDWEYDFRNSELYAFDVSDCGVKPVTRSSGPDKAPAASPDGRHIAWLGYDDKHQAYQLQRLRIARPDGSDRRELLPELDRSVSAFQWSADGKGLYFSYDNHGRSHIAYVTLDGRRQDIAGDLGGTSIGRPYSSGSFSVSNDRKVVYTYTRPEFPADLAMVRGKQFTRLTELNTDLLDHRRLGATREIWWKSSVDGLDLQGWIVTPPDFDATKKYPLLVENHGGPILNYGERFSPEMQLFAAAGYVVFYPNARGSTSYGEAFGNLLYHNYPGEDYNDVMDGVDAMIAEGFVDPDKLFVTGGSAGGIMTAWIVGKTDRFRAAAVIKPVMNWYSKTLNADNWFRYYHDRYPGTPWTNPDDYLRFSPISLVGNVTTPTMVMVGLDDLRTPPSQAKQLYHALKYRKVDTLLVELPGASHFIARRPSQLIDKIGNILAWFERYGAPGSATGDGA